MRSLRLTISGSDCIVPEDETEILIRALRGLADYAHPSAASTATIFEAYIRQETAVEVLQLEPGEDESLIAALHGLDVEKRLPDGLRCVWNAIRDRATPAG